MGEEIVDIAVVEPTAETPAVVPDTPKTEAVDKPIDEPKAADDWRTRYADGDEKSLKRLSRYATEADLFKGFQSLEKKIAAGELKSPLPKDATPEQLTEWRKSNGIPESADKYDLNFENGLVIGENEKPLIDEFVSKMHSKNANQEQVKEAIASYYEIQSKQQQSLLENDSNYKSESEESLREEWGGDYKKNVTAVNNLVNNLPEGVGSAIINARSPDGKLLGANPEVLKALASLAYEINPAAYVMPNVLDKTGSAVNERLDVLKKLVGNPDSEYWVGKNKDKIQKEFFDLKVAQQKMQEKL